MILDSFSGALHGPPLQQRKGGHIGLFNKAFLWLTWLEQTQHIFEEKAIDFDSFL